MYLILTALAVIIIFFILYQKNQKNLPPGPWGFPILGHLPLLGAEPYKKCLEWKAIYGPIISLRFGSLSAVVLQEEKLIKEAFSLQALADRAHTKHFERISSGYKGLIFGNGKGAVEQRRFLLPLLRDFGLGRSSMEEKIMMEVTECIEDLESEVTSMTKGQPMSIKNRFKASVINSFCSIFLSRKFQKDDPEFQCLLKSAHNAMSSPGVLGDIAAFIPWLGNLIPEYSGLNKQFHGFEEVYDFAQQEIQKHYLTRVKGQPRDFTDAYLDKIEDTVDPTSTFHKSQNYQRIVTGDYLFGAMDTTSTALEWLILHLVRNPEIQAKLYEEVTSVTFNSRSTCLNDRPSLPYTDALTRELLRLSTIGPLGLLHWSIEDVTVGGYVIPKDTMVIANLYGIHHDEVNFPQPDEFQPERFLEKGPDGLNYQVKKKLDGYLPFSIGKRVCPGSTQAMDSIFLFTANLSQKFRFEPEDNRMPTLDMNYGLVATPKDFKVKIYIR